MSEMIGSMPGPDALVAALGSAGYEIRSQEREFGPGSTHLPGEPPDVFDPSLRHDFQA
ncbi:hypothetical protein ACFWA6_25940 [Streptomyces sp. NPDC060020]|uniref:hypothetical protein n=1 Tax=Streptomyces sp. NPDC060020 TaxID=3347038 RepID=UPI0036CE612C